MRQPLNVMRLRTPITDPSLQHCFAGAFGVAVRAPSQRNSDGIHQGWDLLASPGTVVYSVSKGKVHEVYSHLTGYGRAVVVEFEFRGEQLYAIYGHLSTISVKKNQELNEGEGIGRTGMSGNAGGTQPHLHFGIMTSPIPQRGMRYFVSPGHVLGYTCISGFTTDDHTRLDMG